MENYESVIIVIVVPYHFGKFLPHRRLHVGRVDERIECAGIYSECEFPQFGNFFHQYLEVKWPERPVNGVFFHTYGSSRINQEQGCLVVFHIPKSLVELEVVTSATVSVSVPFNSAIFAAMSGMLELSFLVPLSGDGAR